MKLKKSRTWCLKEKKRFYTEFIPKYSKARLDFSFFGEIIRPLKKYKRFKVVRCPDCNRRLTVSSEYDMDGFEIYYYIPPHKKRS